MPFSAGSVSFSDLSSAPSVSGVNNGRYWRLQPNSGTPLYDRRQVTYPGMDGLFIKKFGYRGRVITLDAIYIGSSYNGVMAQIETDRSTLKNTLFTVTLPWGTTFQNCQLEGLPDGRAAFYGSQRIQMLTASFFHTGD